MRRIGLAICRAWWWLVRVSPVVLAGLSAYYLFFIILPFFVLGVYQLPLHVLVSEDVMYEHAMGVPASLPAVILVVARWGAALATWVWLFSFVNFCRTGNRWVLALLLIAPLPIAYVNAGPYVSHIDQWIFD